VVGTRSPGPRRTKEPSDDIRVVEVDPESRVVGRDEERGLTDERSML
jgi:hypothetical protein